MMATNDIFEITGIKKDDGQIIAGLTINSRSEIFKGHFPGQPVVPGACMLQVVKDVLASALADTFRLKKAGHLKFVNMIVPGNEVLLLNIVYKMDEEDLSVTAKLSSADVVCFKFQGLFVKI